MRGRGLGAAATLYESNRLMEVYEPSPNDSSIYEQKLEACPTADSVLPELTATTPYNFEGLINQYPVLESLIKSSAPADIYNLCKSSKSIRDCVSTQNVLIETPREENKIRPSSLFFHQGKFWVAVPQSFEKKEGELTGHILLETLLDTPFQIETLYIHITENKAKTERLMSVPIKEAANRKLHEMLKKVAKNIIIQFNDPYHPKVMNEVIELSKAFWIIFGKDTLPRKCEKFLPSLLTVGKVTVTELNNENEEYFSMNFLAHIRTVENCIIGLTELQKLVKAFCNADCKMQNHVYKLKTRTKGTDILDALSGFMKKKEGAGWKEKDQEPKEDEDSYNAYWEGDENGLPQFNRFVIRHGDKVLNISFNVDLATADFLDITECGVALDVLAT